MIITALPRRQLAMDRETVRSTDEFGRLHVSVANISKATVNPYFGREIPDWMQWALDPNRVYYMLRDPAELARAVPTFNNLPILIEHVPVTAELPQREFWAGCTGDSCSFDDPYLRNSVSVWTQEAIDTINDDTKRELSSSYRYVADMRPGNFKGLPYDGVMRDIVGNHVALVEVGRAGPDVFIGDADMIKSRRALMLSGAITAAVRPLLAADASIDLSPILTGVTARNMARRKDKIAAGVMTAVNGKLLAADGLDVEEIASIIETIAGAADEKECDDEMVDAPKPGGDDEDKDDKADDEDPDKNKADDADPDKDDKADDEDPDEKKDKPAMDHATVTSLVAKAVDRERANQSAIRVALDAVRPLAGELHGAYDSAADVYKVPLIAAGIDLKDVHPSAYRSMVDLLAKTSNRREPAMASDAAFQTSRSSFAEAFPKAAPLIKG